MPKTAKTKLRAAGTVLAVLLLCGSCFGPDSPPERSRQTQMEERPRIRPSLHGVTIPPTIAPLTFVVKEPGVGWALRIESPGAGSWEMVSDTPSMRIPLQPWRSLLAEAAGSDVALLVSVKDAQESWRAFAPVVVHVSKDPMDPFLAYRRIRPLYNFWRDIGIHQRDLASWDEWPLLRGTQFAQGCTNCHTFANGNVDTMTVGIRSKEYGSATLLYRDGELTKLATKWGYTSWHPTGECAAYSLNKVRQFFHSVGEEVRDVCDLDSDLAVYFPDENRVMTAPAIADPDYLETYPSWSADGTELYFCRARIPWEDRDRVPPSGYRDLRYSLMKASFDLKTRRFGPPEVVISAEDTGKSVLLPRPSPDGRFLLFCMCDYGCFPIYQPSSDLYLLDLRTAIHRRLEINSERSESWHSWSSNSRWFAFSSKRRDGVFTRTYLCHIDEDGNLGKPFILPMKDPAYYDGCLQTFSVPEFVTERVRVSAGALARAVRSPVGTRVDLPPMSMTAPKKPATGSRGAMLHAWEPAPRK